MQVLGVEENAVEISHHYAFTPFLPSRGKFPNPFGEERKCGSILVSLPRLHAVDQLQGNFAILRIKG